MMKKILLAITVFVISLTANAQGIEIQDANGNAVASFGSTYTAVLRNTPSTSFNATGHDYVEIGGLKWATMNIGAKTVAASAETCYGDYFAWGADKTWYTENTVTEANGTIYNLRAGKSGGYSNADAPYYEGSAYTKYTGTDEGGDNKTKLEPMDDIAHLVWGGTWRMPTKDDFTALANDCQTSGYTSGSIAPDKTTFNASSAAKTATLNSKNIYFVTASSTYSATATCGSNTLVMKVPGMLFCNGTNMVFFPAAGYTYNKTLLNTDTYGNYWSSSLLTINNAYYVYFYSSEVGPQGDSNRFRGFSIRPVSE